MPIYEYHCKDCSRNHEIIQKLTDEPLKICPACEGSLEKKLSLSAFQLKGSGWYKDGYASSSAKTPEKPAESSKKTETPAKNEPAKSPVKPSAAK